MSGSLLLQPDEACERYLYCSRCKRVRLHRIHHTTVWTYNGRLKVFFESECRYVRVKVKRYQLLCGYRDSHTVPWREWVCLFTQDPANPDIWVDPYEP